MALTARYGGKNGKSETFHFADDLIAIRFSEDQPQTNSRGVIDQPTTIANTEEIARFDDARVKVVRLVGRDSAKRSRDTALASLKRISGLRFAGRVLLSRGSSTPVLYTENFFVRFSPDTPLRECRKVIKGHGLRIRRTYPSLKRTFFLAAPVGVGAKRTFEIAKELLADDRVELCHPELVRPKSTRKAHPAQWHLKPTKIGGQTISAHAQVEKAWALSTGKGTAIGIIDDGVDIDHQDFAMPQKVLRGRDITCGTDDPRPKWRANPSADLPGDAHGTACAGVACATGQFDSSGVAPDAQLIPIRLSNGTGVGSMAEHDAIVWAVDNGADVISCSWGPRDGAWWDPDDPRHFDHTPLPDLVRTALEYATEHGRGGKGCVITWAAGNGNESVDNDGYASSDYVMAIAACNDRSKRSVYSDYGHAIWCAFPSNDFAFHDRPAPRSPGIWTTDREDIMGEGYNPSFSGGDADGKYTESFGGTSSAAPGVAGIAALMLSVNPGLTWIDVCNIIAETCDQIDSENGDYDPATGHSHQYGFGRANAYRAVSMAVQYGK